MQFRRKICAILYCTLFGVGAIINMCNLNGELDAFADARALITSDSL